MLLIKMSKTSEMVGTADACYIPKLYILNSLQWNDLYYNTLFYTSDMVCYTSRE